MAKIKDITKMTEKQIIDFLMKDSPESLGYKATDKRGAAKGGMMKKKGYAKGGLSVKEQMIADRKKAPTSNLMEAIRRRLTGKGNLTAAERRAIANMDGSSGKGGRGKARRPAGFGISSSTRKSGTGKARKPAGFGVSSNTRKNITTGGKPKTKEPRRMADPSASAAATKKSGMIPDTVPQERRTTPEGKMAAAAKRGPSNTRKNIGTAGKKPSTKTRFGTSPAKTAAKGPVKTKKPVGKPNTEPRTIAEAKRQGKLYFVDKNGKKKAAVTAEMLKKSGHKSLRAYLNAKGKPAKKGS